MARRLIRSTTAADEDHRGLHLVGQRVHRLLQRALTRVDFRALVRDLGGRLRRAWSCGRSGRGTRPGWQWHWSCGRDLCCATFLKDFEPVSVRHGQGPGTAGAGEPAADRGSRPADAPPKYEHPLYQDFRKDAPPMEPRLPRPRGPGRSSGTTFPRTRWSSSCPRTVRPARARRPACADPAGVRGDARQVEIRLSRQGGAERTGKSEPPARLSSWPDGRGLVRFVTHSARRRARGCPCPRSSCPRPSRQEDRRTVDKLRSAEV